MVKAIFLLKRRADLTHEQFRAHYEAHHARLGQKYFGHLLTGYVRNYVNQVGDVRGAGQGAGGFGYDCITEFFLRDEAAVGELTKILTHPVVGKEFQDDGEQFLDREAMVTIICPDQNVVDTGSGDAQASIAALHAAGAA